MSNKPRINDDQHAADYPMKYAVWKDDAGGGIWYVARGEDGEVDFATHAEALAYAIKEAGA